MRCDVRVQEAATATAAAAATACQIVVWLFYVFAISFTPLKYDFCFGLFPKCQTTKQSKRTDNAVMCHLCEINKFPVVISTAYG